MVRYYFNLHDHSGLLRDEEGLEIADLDKARDKALENARAIISDEAKSGVLDLTSRIEVVNTEGEIVFVIRFDEAIQPRE